jgi:hypothetical protein
MSGAPRSQVGSSPKLAPPAFEYDGAAVDLVAAIIANAERLASDVARLVDAWRLHVPGFADRPLTRDDLLKIGALVELARWERGAVTPHLRTAVPPASAVLADVIAPPAAPRDARFDGAGLARRLFAARFSELAWEPLTTPARADVVVASLRPDDLWDDLANFLWRHRGLARTPQDGDAVAEDRTKE